MSYCLDHGLGWQSSVEFSRTVHISYNGMVVCQAGWKIFGLMTTVLQHWMALRSCLKGAWVVSRPSTLSGTLV
jgi:hypothetical protein